MAVQLIERFAFVFLPLSGEDNMTIASQPTPHGSGTQQRRPQNMELLSIVVPLIRACYEKPFISSWG